METRKQKLERQLADLYDLSESVMNVDAYVYNIVIQRIEELEGELNNIPNSSKGRENNLFYDTEALVILMEECGELIQAASKVIRFGMTNENIERLTQEMGDVFCLIDILQNMDMVSFTEIDRASSRKYEKLKKYSNLPLD